MSKELYDKLKIIPIIIIIVSIFIIGINMINKGNARYLNFADNIVYSSQDTENSNFKININNASFNDLMKLPGVGIDVAMNIIEYRYDSGGFKNIYELLLVKGIDEDRFKKLISSISIN